MQFKDQIGRVFELKKTPQRVVCLVPSQTELLCDLDLEDALVGLTKFCVHPNHIKTTKTIVGGTKQVKQDKIIALNPDIILCNKEENTKDIVEMCEQICPVHVSDIKSINDCIDMILQYGRIFNKEKKALELKTLIQKELKGFKEFISVFPSLKVAYFIWKAPWMVAGSGTFINYLLSLNKFENVFQTQSRYPEVTLDKLASKTLDIVLLSSEPYPFKEEHQKDLQQQVSQHTKVMLVDGEMFSWYGSRLIKALTYFKQLRTRL